MQKLIANFLAQAIKKYHQSKDYGQSHNENSLFMYINTLVAKYMC